MHGRYHVCFLLILLLSGWLSRWNERPEGTGLVVGIRCTPTCVSEPSLLGDPWSGFGALFLCSYWISLNITCSPCGKCGFRAPGCEVCGACLVVVGAVVWKICVICTESVRIWITSVFQIQRDGYSLTIALYISVSSHLSVICHSWSPLFPSPSIGLWVSLDFCPSSSILSASANLSVQMFWRSPRPWCGRWTSPPSAKLLMYCTCAAVLILSLQ